jgi:hypothetical protein
MAEYNLASQIAESFNGQTPLEKPKGFVPDNSDGTEPVSTGRKILGAAVPGIVSLLAGLGTMAFGKGGNKGDTAAAIATGAYDVASGIKKGYDVAQSDKNYQKASEQIDKMASQGMTDPNLMWKALQKTNPRLASLIDPGELYARYTAQQNKFGEFNVHQFNTKNELQQAKANANKLAFFNSGAVPLNDGTMIDHTGRGRKELLDFALQNYPGKYKLDASHNLVFDDDAVMGKFMLDLANQKVGPNKDKTFDINTVSQYVTSGSGMLEWRNRELKYKQDMLDYLKNKLKTVPKSSQANMEKEYFRTIYNSLAGDDSSEKLIAAHRAAQAALNGDDLGMAQALQGIQTKESFMGAQREQTAIDKQIENALTNLNLMPADDPRRGAAMTTYTSLLAKKYGISGSFMVPQNNTTGTEKHEVDRQVSASTGKIKIIYSDGSEEIIDGK